MSLKIALLFDLQQDLYCIFFIRIKGKLHLCSRSLIFEPNNIDFPLPEKFGKTPKRVLLTLAIDGSEHLLELRNTEVDKIKRLKIKVFSYGVNESESEVKNEKEKYQKNFIGRSRFIRRRPLKIGKLAQKAISGGHI